MYKHTVNCNPCKGLNLPLLHSNEEVNVYLDTENQTWLGKCIIVPKDHMTVFKYYAEGEYEIIALKRSIEDIIDVLKVVFEKKFKLTRMDVYQTCDNTLDERSRETTLDEYSHVQIHFIPRYRDKIQYGGMTFQDIQWGKPLNLDIPAVRLPKEVQSKLVEELTEAVTKEANE